MPYSKPSALIFSHDSLLANYFVRKLNTFGCITFVYNFDSRDKVEHDLPASLNYCLFIGFFNSEATAKISQKDFKKKLSAFIDFISKEKRKIVLVLPYTVTSKKLLDLNKQVLDSFERSNLVYQTAFLGDIVDQSATFSDSFLFKVIYQAVVDEKVKIPKNADFYLLTVTDACEFVSKLLFSFQVKKEQILIAHKKKAQDVINILENLIDGISIESHKEDRFFIEGKDLRIVVPKSSPEKELIGQVSKIKNLFLKRQILVKKKKKIKKHFFLRKKRKFIFVLLALILIVLAPFYFSFLAISILMLSYKSFESGNLTLTKSFIKVASANASIAAKTFVFYSYLPLVGNSFSYLKEKTLVLDRLTGVGEKSLEVFQDSKILLDGIVGEKDYNLDLVSQRIATNLDYIYKESSFIQSELEEFTFISEKLKGSGLSLSRLRSVTSEGAKIATKLPELLGTASPKTYLLLFQNNAELRPTGGFIGSFGLVTFNKGKLININVYDVYTADGQLKGHVEPPIQIKNYLGEANWYLRDSNWEADFPTSATRAEWFLDKELERQVNGVVAIDLRVAKAVLTVLGPVYLKDFDQTIDAKNIYEKVQYTVQDEFFPGSHRKANILSALSDALLSKIIETKDSEKLIDLSKAFFDNLESRSIQLYIHDETLSSSLKTLNWDGGVNFSSCQGNCFSSSFGVVEANLGVNKANYFVKRFMNFSSYIGDKQLTNYLSINLVNNSPNESSLFGRYKVYLRLLLDPKSIVKKVEVVGKDKVTLNPELRQKPHSLEAGVLIEVPAGQKKTVLFSWDQTHNLDPGKSGSINYYWRKQAGTEDDQVFVQTYPFFLTSGSVSKYNTHLSKDYYFDLKW